MKKLIGVILIVVLCFGSVGVSYAAENDPYKEIVEKYNEEYGVDLGYVPVQGEFDLALYDEVIRDLAKNQRDTLSYIAARRQKAEFFPSRIVPNSVIIGRQKTKTVTAYSASSQSPSLYECEATYIMFEGNVFGKVISVDAITKNNLIGPIYSYQQRSYTTNYYDAGRTLDITVVGSLTIYSEYIGVGTVDNVITAYSYTDTY